MKQVLAEAGLDPGKFEPLDGEFGARHPYELLGRHPDGRLAAMRAGTWAAVWELESGKLAWRSEGVFGFFLGERWNGDRAPADAPRGGARRRGEAGLRLGICL